MRLHKAVIHYDLHIKQATLSERFYDISDVVYSIILQRCNMRLGVSPWCARRETTQTKALTWGFGDAAYWDHHYALISSPHSEAAEEFLGADRTTPLSAYDFLSSLHIRGLLVRKGEDGLAVDERNRSLLRSSCNGRKNLCTWALRMLRREKKKGSRLSRWPLCWDTGAWIV